MLSCISTISDRLFVKRTTQRNCDYNTKLIFSDSAWDLSKWQPLIENRAFLSWLVQTPDDEDRKKSRNIKIGEINTLEELWKRRPEATLKDLQNPTMLEEEPETRPVTLTDEDAYGDQQTFAPVMKRVI